MCVFANVFFVICACNYLKTTCWFLIKITTIRCLFVSIVVLQCTVISWMYSWQVCVVMSWLSHVDHVVLVYVVVFPPDTRPSAGF